MNNDERIAKLKSILEKLYDPEFDFSIEHWENGNFDDSYSYGCDCGEQWLVLKLIKELELELD